MFLISNRIVPVFGSFVYCGIFSLSKRVSLGFCVIMCFAITSPSYLNIVRSLGPFNDGMVSFSNFILRTFCTVLKHVHTVLWQTYNTPVRLILRIKIGKLRIAWWFKCSVQIGMF